MTTTEPVYQVSQVKIHYHRADDVTSIEEVPASRLFAELYARGVPSRLCTYEDATSETVNGEFTQWRLVRRGGAAMTNHETGNADSGQDTAAGESGPPVTCGQPWVAEIQSCPRCHRPALEHPERNS